MIYTLVEIASIIIKEERRNTRLSFFTGFGPLV